MSTNISSIPPDVNMAQVTQISEFREFRRFKPERDYNMEDDLARLKAAINGLSHSILAEHKARQVLHFVAEHNGVTITEIRGAISQRYSIELGYAVAKRIVEQLEKEQWCVHTEQSQKQTGIKAVHVFHLVSTLHSEDVLQILSEHNDSPPQFKVEESAPLPLVQPQLSESDNSPYALLTRTLELLRSSAREKHFEVLSLVAQDVSSMSALTNLTGDRPQSIHARLAKLTFWKLLGREKRDVGRGLEFHYFLVSQITIEDLKRFALEHGFPFPDANLLTQSQSDPQRQEVTMLSQSSSSPSDSANAKIPTHEKLLDHLPKFDPSWSDEIKADWIKAYRQIAELAQKSPETN